MQAVEVGNPTRAVDYEAGVDAGRCSGGVDTHPVTGERGPNSDDRCVAKHTDASLFGSGNEEFDKVRIEFPQRSGPAVDDRALRTGTSGDVRELERDEAAADEHHSARQLIEIQEPGPVDQDRKS